MDVYIRRQTIGFKSDHKEGKPIARLYAGQFYELKEKDARSIAVSNRGVIVTKENHKALKDEAELFNKQKKEAEKRAKEEQAARDKENEKKDPPKKDL